MGTEEKVTQKYSIEKDEEGVHSVSTTTYEFLEDAGYRTVNTRRQLVTKEYLDKALKEELDFEIEQLQGKVDESDEMIKKMHSELDPIISKESYKKFKEKWDKKFKPFVGALSKEAKLNNSKQEVKSLMSQLKQLEEAKVHYQEILDNHLN